MNPVKPPIRLSIEPLPEDPDAPAPATVVCPGCSRASASAIGRFRDRSVYECSGCSVQFFRSGPGRQ